MKVFILDDISFYTYKYTNNFFIQILRATNCLIRYKRDRQLVIVFMLLMSFLALVSNKVGLAIHRLFTYKSDS